MSTSHAEIEHRTIGGMMKMIDPDKVLADHGDLPLQDDKTISRRFVFDTDAAVRVLLRKYDALAQKVLELR